jgi:DNA-binding NarL/FixJ family response regulator
MDAPDSASNHRLLLPPGSLEEVRSRLGLTPREFEIALSLLAGHTEKGSAKALQSRPATVHSHVERIYRKLEVRSRSGLITKLFAAYLRVEGGRES